MRKLIRLFRAEIDGVELKGAGAVGAVDQEAIVSGERLRLEIAAVADGVARGDLPYLAAGAAVAGSDDPFPRQRRSREAIKETSPRQHQNSIRKANCTMRADPFWVPMTPMVLGEARLATGSPRLAWFRMFRKSARNWNFRRSQTVKSL